MRIIIFGAGAIGSMIGGLLSRQHHVTLVGRREHMEAVRARGLVIRGAIEAILHPSSAESVGPRDSADLVIITVKSYDTQEALNEVGKMRGDFPVCLIQNGLRGYTLLLEQFGERGVVGLTTSGVATLTPGEVLVAGIGDTVFGSPAGRKGYPELLAGVFRSAGMHARVSDEIVSEIWMKAVVNASINPVTALLGCTNGVLASPELERLVRDVVDEGVAVAMASSVRLPPCDLFDKTMEVVKTTSENRSSMLQDVQRGRRTEIREINGEIVRRGEEVGIDTPVNRTLLSLVECLSSQTDLD